MSNGCFNAREGNKEEHRRLISPSRYFNTVGSKEGWTPSSFVSSRLNRAQDGDKARQQRAEDFMDEEDLADAAEAQLLQTSASFSGLGRTEDDVGRQGPFMDVFKMEGDTMGVRLLRKMGWRDGQGIGAKVRRKARLDDDVEPGKKTEHDGEELWFAPQNTVLVAFTRKNDQKGLGYQGEARLEADDGRSRPSNRAEEHDDGGPEFSPVAQHAKSKGLSGSVRGGFGVGILNDTGSDDEDPYAIGPRISYNKAIGGPKKKKKRDARLTEKGRTAAISGAANPLLGSKPVFISKRASSSAKSGFRKCHDGRLPLDGFILAADSEDLAAIVENDNRYPPPDVPEDWMSSKKPSSTTGEPGYRSVAEAAKASVLDPKARASLLGEVQLPGKSVFDFLSPAARDRIVSASGRQNLPAAMSEVAPKGFAVDEAERQRQLRDFVPNLDKDVALKALGRGVGGWMPYLEDEAKRARYRAFLEIQAGLRGGLPERSQGSSTDEWIQELHEFAHAAQIFKPMTGMMASRFTSARSQSQPSAQREGSSSDPSSAETLLRNPADNPEDPAEAAAKVGMYGPMTRSTQMFYPTRLLCKRFNVRPPVHVQPDAQGGSGTTTVPGSAATPAPAAAKSTALPTKSLELVSTAVVNDMLRDTNRGHLVEDTSTANGKDQQTPTVDTTRNLAIEGERPGDAVFRAIFGSSDNEDDDDE